VPHERRRGGAEGGIISEAAAAEAGEFSGRLGDTAGFLLAKAGGRAIRDLNRALEPFGLRSRHYGVLAAATEYGGLSQRELGAVLAIDPSAIVALVDDLERSRLVRRQLHPGDRRTRLIVTTTEGQAVLARARELSAAVDDELLASFTGKERASLLRLLRRITTATAQSSQADRRE
jgi:DNA-binding MarR family transcriptional regulator